MANWVALGLSTCEFLLLYGIYQLPSTRLIKLALSSTSVYWFIAALLSSKAPLAQNYKPSISGSILSKFLFETQFFVPSIWRYRKKRWIRNIPREISFQTNTLRFAPSKKKPADFVTPLLIAQPMILRLFSHPQCTIPNFFNRPQTLIISSIDNYPVQQGKLLTQFESLSLGPFIFANWKASLQVYSSEYSDRLALYFECQFSSFVFGGPTAQSYNAGSQPVHSQSLVIEPYLSTLLFSPWLCFTSYGFTPRHYQIINAVLSFLPSLTQFPDFARGWTVTLNFCSYFLPPAGEFQIYFFNLINGELPFSITWKGFCIIGGTIINEPHRRIAGSPVFRGLN